MCAHICSTKEYSELVVAGIAVGRSLLPHSFSLLGDDESAELRGLLVVNLVFRDGFDLGPVKSGAPHADFVTLFPVFQVLTSTERKLAFGVLVEQDVFVHCSVHAVLQLFLVSGHLRVGSDVVGGFSQVDAHVFVTVCECNSLLHYDTGCLANSILT